MGVALGLLGALSLGVLLFWLLGLTQGNDANPWNDDEPPELYEVVRSTVAAGALLAGAAGIVLALRKQQSTEDITKVTLERHQADAVTALRDRYTTAAQQLGDLSPAVRLAGVYAMSALADDWSICGRKLEVQTCIDVLCAYLRTPSPHAGGDASSMAEREVRQTIIRAIIGRLQDSRWNDNEFDFSDAFFDFPMTISSCKFNSRVSFDRVAFHDRVEISHCSFFNRATFASARFEGGIVFANVSFPEYDPDFTDTFFQQGLFNRVRFGDGVGFANSRLINTEFNDVVFQGLRTDFASVSFTSRTTFFKCTFASAISNFCQARFEGAPEAEPASFTISDCSFSGSTSFEMARFSVHTRISKIDVAERLSFDRATFASVSQTQFEHLDALSDGMITFEDIELHGFAGTTQVPSVLGPWDGDRPPVSWPPAAHPPAAQH
jgi:hypothetical protein